MFTELLFKRGQKKIHRIWFDRMNDLRLPSDQHVSVQSHLDELTRRLTAIIILISILTVIWSFSVGDLLKYSLNQMDPCLSSSPCLTVFSPQEWAGMKWLTAALIGILTAGPYAIMQMYSFAKPGLLPSERKTFVSWMIVIWSSASLSLYLITTKFLPWLYQKGHEMNGELALKPVYDATEMLKISVSISWTLVLILSAISIIVLANFTNLIWKGNADWWRIRVYAIMLMMLWIATPTEVPGLFLIMALLAIGSVELFGWKAFSGPIPVAHGLREIYDVDGGIHRILYADCTCCGTSPQIDPLQGMGIVQYDSVCRDIQQQNHLLDQVKKYRISKVVFSGCVVDSFSKDYLKSYDILKCEVVSLNLCYLSSLRTISANVECRLAMANLTAPWSEISSAERSLEIINENDFTTIYYGNYIPFGLHLQKDETWITNPTNALMKELRKSGFSLIQYSN